MTHDLIFYALTGLLIYLWAARRLGVWPWTK